MHDNRAKIRRRGQRRDPQLDMEWHVPSHCLFNGIDMSDMTAGGL